jgi:hypothetical protein
MNDDFIATLVDDDDRWHEDPDDPTVEWKYRVEGDDIPAMDHINDADCWGKLRWNRDNIDTGWSQRPDDFGPHSRILYRDSRQSLWWEPYEWREDRATRDFESEFASVKQVMEDGFCMVALHRREKCPHCGGPERELVEYLGGIDVWPWADEHKYHHTIVEDLAAEILHQVDHQKEHA